MRIEEMYFIEAEAAAHLNSVEGRDLLMGFMKKYRDPQYTTALEGKNLVEEIVFQKRVELWGEGQSFFDVKRLNLSVTRGYEGTNFGETKRFNTQGRPAWMNFCIVQTEKNNNAGIKGYENPDPAMFIRYGRINNSKEGRATGSPFFIVISREIIRIVGRTL